jgi:hypothetical protein
MFGFLARIGRSGGSMDGPFVAPTSYPIRRERNGSHRPETDIEVRGSERLLSDQILLQNYFGGSSLEGRFVRNSPNAILI